MVISDEKTFAFVHIPKCAGTTIRNALRDFDSYSGQLNDWFFYPEGGRQNMHHLPLVDLREYLPELYDKILRYDSYAIVREPRERFASAVLQHLRSFQKLELTRNSAPLFVQKAVEVCHRLESPAFRHTPDLMHFLVQSEFVAVDGVNVIRNLYAFDDLPRFTADLKTRHGIRIDLSVQYNQAHLRNGAVGRMIKKAIGPLHRALLPPGWHRRLRAALRDVSGSSPLPLYRRLFEDKNISAFVDRFYAADFALYRAVRGRS